MDLELQLTRALTKARLMEAILHGRGQWQISLGSWGVANDDLVVPGVRSVEDNQVTIEGAFPAHCWLNDRPTVLMLLHEGEIAAVREINHPGDGGFLASWSFAIEVVEQAA